MIGNMNSYEMRIRTSNSGSRNNTKKGFFKKYAFLAFALMLISVSTMGGGVL